MKQQLIFLVLNVEMLQFGDVNVVEPWETPTNVFVANSKGLKRALERLNSYTSKFNRFKGFNRLNNDSDANTS